MLNPNQTLKSMIISYKEDAVKHIIALAPKVGEDQALKLIERGALSSSDRLSHGARECCVDTSTTQLR